MELSRATTDDSHTHEVIAVFADLGYPLNSVLEAMLNEHHSHRTERRGCGYTQATRHLAEYVNYSGRFAEYDDARLFANKDAGAVPRLLARAAELGQAFSWRNLERQTLAISLREDPEFSELHATELARQRTIGGLLERVTLEESVVLTRIMRDIILPVDAAELGLEELPLCEQPLKIGTCPLAEKYFLEIAERFVRRRGRLNIIRSNDRKPLLIEKLNLGDDHSCISLVPLVLNGVCLPAGSLFGVDYDQPEGIEPNRELPGDVIPLESCKGFRFLRLTTLAISPRHRPRAFSKHFEAQVQNGLFAPGVVEIRQLLAVAKAQLSETP